MEFAMRFGRWWSSIESGLNEKATPEPANHHAPKTIPTVGFYLNNHEHVEETPLHLPD